MAVSLNFEIAGIVFSLTGERSYSLPSDLAPFQTNRPPNVRIEAHAAEELSPVGTREELAFDSRSNWKIYRSGSEWTIVFRSESLGERPYQILSFRKDEPRFEIHSAPVDVLPSGRVHPLEHPLPQLLLISCLSSKRGILVHACGVDIDGNGILLMGSSGAGKSTLASIWDEHGTLLNDERIAVMDGDPIRIFGTPWHGEVRKVNPGGVPLRGVFLIEHGDVNRAAPIGGALAASNLFAGSRIALWDPDAVAFSLELCHKIVDQIPCYRLSFVPDEGVVECIRDLIV
jgi:hypothetical protein